MDAVVGPFSRLLGATGLVGALFAAAALGVYLQQHAVTSARATFVKLARVDTGKLSASAKAAFDNTFMSCAEEASSKTTPLSFARWVYSQLQSLPTPCPPTVDVVAPMLYFFAFFLLSCTDTSHGFGFVARLIASAWIALPFWSLSSLSPPRGETRARDGRRGLLVFWPVVCDATEVKTPIHCQYRIHF